MRRRSLRLAFLLLLLALTAAGASITFAVRRIHRPFPGRPGEARVVEVPPGASSRDILDRLAAAGVIADPLLARLYLRWHGDPPLMAGEYRFTGRLSTPQVLERMQRGEVLLHPVTVVEGWTLRETAEHLASEGFGHTSRLLSAMAGPQQIADLDPQAVDLEGYLFPDSYRFARGAPEEQVVATMVRTFRRRWQREVVGRLVDEGRTVREVVTLASIVEKEARVDEERPLIAGVYENRLRRGIALYADPTVIYALKRLGVWQGRLGRDDLAVDSPYNTYRRAGLPPGPICSPGMASLLAAAAPADTPYLYFVSRNDGTHAFAASLAEHNRNVDRWQRRRRRR